MDEILCNNILKNLNTNPSNVAHKYLLYIKDKYNVNINLHDVAGISNASRDLERIFTLHKYHDNPFCSYIKKTDTLFKLCILNKEKLCGRCKKENSPFYGSCYMGVEELVYPINLNGKLIAVICVGQFYTSLEKSQNKLLNNSQLYKLSSEKVLEKFRQSSTLLDFDIEELSYNILSLVNYISLCFKKEIDREIATNKVSSENTLRSHEKNFIINNTITFISENYNKELSLNLLAANSYCNQTYLSHIFKEKMGIGITDYINDIRVQKSRELLDITSKSITEICMQVGFNDSSYFSKVFKMLIGTTPKEYRTRET